MDLQLASAEQAIADVLYSRYKDMGAAFSECDARRDGCITADEFRTFLQKFGLNFSQATIEGIVRKYDTSNTGVLSFVEFVRFNEAHSVAQYEGGRPHTAYAFAAAQGRNSGVVATHLDTLQPDKRQRAVDLMKKVRDSLRQKVGSHALSRSLTSLFVKMDTHRTGRLTYDEIFWALSDLNIRLTATELVDMLMPFDIRLNGYIDFEQFVTFLSAGEDPLHPRVAGAVEPAYQDLHGMSPDKAGRSPSQASDSGRDHMAYSVTIGEGCDDSVAISKISRQLDVQRLKLRKAFELMDHGGTGKLSVEDFVKGCAEQGIMISDRKARSLLSKYDFDNDGRIHYYEFVRMLSSAQASAYNEGQAQASAYSAGQAQALAYNAGQAQASAYNAGQAQAQGQAQVQGLVQAQGQGQGKVQGQGQAQGQGQVQGPGHADEDPVAIIQKISSTVYSSYSKLMEGFHDLSHNGKTVTASEFRQGLDQHMAIKLTQTEADGLFKKFASHDGELSYSDFVRMLAAGGTRL